MVNKFRMFIDWKKPSAEYNEEMATNVAHGTLLHDHFDYMPAAEKAVLYAGTSVPGAALPAGQTEDKREEIIEQNYKTYRTQYANRSLQKLAVGEMVTLYAKPDEGYTVVWIVSSNAAVVDTKNLVNYIYHKGPSFTFEVTNELQGVYYYFVPVNSAGETLLSGKVITLNASLANTHFTEIDMPPRTHIGCATQASPRKLRRWMRPADVSRPRKPVRLKFLWRRRLSTETRFT